MGLLGVAVAAWGFKGRPSGIAQPRQRVWLSPPGWAWALLGLLGAAFRLMKISTLSTWPMPDDAEYAVLAWDIRLHGLRELFAGSMHLPMVYPACQALWFRCFGLSASTLWGFPAMFSIATIPFVIALNRKIFKPWVALGASLMGICSYWLLLAGRYNMATVWAPLGELGALLVLFHIHEKSEPTTFQRGLGLALGAALVWGANAYVYVPAWPVMLAWFSGMGVIGFRRNWPGQAGRLTAIYFGTLFITLIPILTHLTLLTAYPRTLMAGFGSGVLAGLRTPLEYWAGLFWWDTPGSYYGPIRGGLVNALLGAFFWVGIVRIIRQPRKGLHMALASGLVLSVLPAAISNNLEFFRLILAWPFVVGIAALGFEALFQAGTPMGIPAALALSITLLSAGWDGQRLVGVYASHWKSPGPGWQDQKSPEWFRAYGVLESTQEAEGPGWVFQAMGNDMHDQSLTCMTLPFNLALQPDPTSAAGRWFAVVTNPHYRPFLDRRFPGGRWTYLSRGYDRVDGGWSLGVYPVASASPETLRLWIQANQAFQETALRFLKRPTGADYSGVTDQLRAVKPLLGDDRFLMACWGEKNYYMHLQESAFGNGRKAENLTKAGADLMGALRDGYPAAHLLNEMGSFFEIVGRPDLAGGYYRSAIASPINLTPAAGNLATLPRGRPPVPAKPAPGPPGP